MDSDRTRKVPRLIMTLIVTLAAAATVP